MAQSGRRLTIYVPPELAERLDRVKDKVNPSRASQAGLQQAIAAEEKKLGYDERKTRILERLLASEEERTRVYRQGLAVGQRWAESVATWKELKAFAGYNEVFDADQQIAYGAPPSVPLGVAALAWQAALAQSGPPKVYVPTGVPDAPSSLSSEQRTMWWRGVQRGVKEVFELVRDAMEPPAPPKKVNGPTQPPLGPNAAQTA